LGAEKRVKRSSGDGRLISYKKQCNDVGLLLGQWHTSKAMLGALIKIFSGYGIFDVAAALGVQYLDKLNKVVDYWVTSHVIELIWMLRVVVGKCMTY